MIQEKNIIKITKKREENKAQYRYINIPMKEKDKRENMEEIDTKICLKKTNKKEKENGKNNRDTTNMAF